jgi:DNA (cytosine-5)-methyltransferase 3A
MNVLSLFDGISCARVALDRAGIEVNAYMASEIEKNAIKVSEKNYPDIIRVGSVVNLEVEGEVDLLIGGSPCQDLSIAKKDRKGLEGDKSTLFWEYVRIKKECKPKWFILENVASMPKKDRDIITKEMGVEPVLFNASLVSAQCRKRLFWTNIKFDLPVDRGILLKDILQPDGEIDARFVVDGRALTLTPNKKPGEFVQVGYFGAENQCKVGGAALRVYDANAKTPTLASSSHLVKIGHLGNSNAQGNRVYSADGKAVTLSANGGGLGAKTGLYWKPTHYPIHVLDGASTETVRVGQEQRRKLKDGKRADDDPSIEAVRRIETRNDDKCGTLTTVQKDNQLIDIAQSRIRKLTPIECERLQGLPDNYTEGVAITHRYKCLGNAFHVDVVAHILGNLQQPRI